MLQERLLHCLSLSEDNYEGRSSMKDHSLEHSLSSLSFIRAATTQKGRPDPDADFILCSFVPNVAADRVSLRIVPILPIHMCTLLPQCSSTCERICQLLILQHHTCGQDRVSLTVDRGTARKTYGPQGMEADGCAYERTNLVRAVQGPMHCPFDISSGSTQGLLIFFLAS